MSTIKRYCSLYEFNILCCMNLFIINTLPSFCSSTWCQNSTWFSFYGQKELSSLTSLLPGTRISNMGHQYPLQGLLQQWHEVAGRVSSHQSNMIETQSSHCSYNSVSHQSWKALVGLSNFLFDNTSFLNIHQKKNKERVIFCYKVISQKGMKCFKLLLPNWRLPDTLLIHELLIITFLINS